MDGNLTNISAESAVQLQTENPLNAASGIIQAIRAPIDTVPVPESAAVTPEVAARQAIEAERKRIEEIDAIASLYDEETVKNAKYVNPCTAQVMTYRAALQLAKTGAKFIENLQIDAQNSGVQDVPAAVSPDFIKLQTPKNFKEPEDKMKAARAYIDSVLEGMNKGDAK